MALRTADLHVKLDQSIIEARRNESLLSEVRAKQEDTARLLKMSQQQCRNYDAAVERQRRYLARQAALEHNLRAHIAELEVMCESQEQYYERELEVAANRLTEAQTMLDDLVKAAFRHATEGELEIRQLQELLTTYEGQLNCAVCMDKQRTVSFGCGHTACRDCAKPLRECHICRRAVHKLYTIYL
ncbi:E3 ubiquitin-protein ligase MIB2-like protein [Aphelenchoides avenae]|nr:E3 ubiquitin-protein ligase MIB2-like protein [Aphelenchus avenae]